jgi:hypothetical protein
LKELLQKEGNGHCFECGESACLWASVNNAVFLCLKCAGVHRGLGVSVSFVRSITLDSWSEAQLLTMKAGGNTRLALFLDSFGIAQSASPEYKYNTKAMTYYRELLKCETEYREPPEAPSPMEAIKRESRMQARLYPPIGPDEAQPAPARDSIEEGKELVMQFGTKAKDGITSILAKGKEKYQ